MVICKAACYDIQPVVMQTQVMGIRLILLHFIVFYKFSISWDTRVTLVGFVYVAGAASYDERDG